MKTGKYFVVYILILLLAVFNMGSCETVENASGESTFGSAFAPETSGTPAPVQNGKKRVVLDVPYISQHPDYPAGCEGVSAVMLMNYLGFDVDTDYFFDNALDAYPFTFDWRTNTYYGEDLDRYYVGDPTSKHGKGCFAPVIKTAVEKLLPEDYIAVVEQGDTVQSLADKYLNEMKTPIIIWATIEMRDSFEGTTWRISRTGRDYTFPAYMHCLVLVGYDDEEGLFWFNDPYENNGLTAYEKSIVEEKFKELGSQALAIVKRADYRADSAKVVEGAYYYIRNAATGKFLTSPDGETFNGVNAVQGTYTGEECQQFSLEFFADGSASLVCRASGRVLCVESSDGEDTDGCNVVIKQDVAADAGRFLITKEKGFNKISLKVGGSSLTVCGNYNGDVGDTRFSAGNVYAGSTDGDGYYSLWEFVKAGVK